MEPTLENAANIVKALEQFGFGSLGLKAEDFLVPDQIIQLGYPPNRIDLLTTASGVEFETGYASRVEVEVDGVTVNSIDLPNPKKNRKQWGDCRIWPIWRTSSEPWRAPGALPGIAYERQSVISGGL